MNANPAPPTPADAGVSRNARLGLILFFIYCAFYIGFILVSAYGKALMSRPVFHGVNFAIIYGFVLIIGALLLALIYMILCVPERAAIPDLTEGELADEAQKEEGAA